MAENKSSNPKQGLAPSIKNPTDGAITMGQWHKYRNEERVRFDKQRELDKK